VIAGFGGGLISHMYVEERVLPALDRAGLAAFERRLVRWWHHVSRSLGPASSTRAVADIAVIPLLQLLDHDRPAISPIDGGYAAHLGASVLLVIPWAESPSSVWRDALRLGLAAGGSWAIVSNGRSLRIVDCTRAWTRAAIDFDFEPLISGPKGVAAFWTFARAAALRGTDRDSLRSHVAASDSHASRVCRSLGDGVLAALPALTTALAIHPRARTDRAIAFDQALTLVYRVLFLLFAEARALVPVWNDVYRSWTRFDKHT